MKLRLFPRQEDAYFGLFQAAADTIAAATVLVDLLTDLADPETKAKQLAELEHEGDRITRTILTPLASTLIARLDCDDIFELPERLDNVDSRHRRRRRHGLPARHHRTPGSGDRAGPGPAPGGRAHQLRHAQPGTDGPRPPQRLPDRHA
jgi:hypothetical protein